VYHDAHAHLGWTMLTFLRRLLDRFRVAPQSGPRVTGLPASSNGASSFHVNWEMPPDRSIVAVEATLEILVPPVVDRLHFWALQASFVGPEGRLGGAHLGLQWHPSHPGHTAVNWGGYDRNGLILDGTSSDLPSARGNANTRDYAWAPATPYRLRISPGSNDGWWLGEVTNLVSGETTKVRELHPGGERLISPVVWSEVFARCDDPGVTVRWSDLTAIDDQGGHIQPAAVRANYQSHESGGCANTSTTTDGIGVLQETSTMRATPQGGRLTL